MSSFCHIWERLTSDASILQIISGECIEFLSDPPLQVSHPPNSVPRNHVSLVDKEIERLLDKGVIVPCEQSLVNSFHLYLLCPRRMAMSDLF